MNEKELTPIEAFERIKNHNTYTTNVEFKIVQNALTQAEDINDLKHIRNTKVKEHLCDVFQRLGFDKNTRYAYIEHIYYSYQEMKETLEKQLEDIKKQAEENEKELNELKEFVKIVLSKGIDAPLIKEYPNITYVDYNMKSRFELGNYTQTEFDLIKKVVEKYGKKLL